MTILVPAHNEASVIDVNVRAARAVDYPDLEILVLDDGSTDETVSVATAAAEGDERVEVLRDPTNRGKAERLNLGFGRARNELVVVTDADTHLHPLAIKLLVSRIVALAEDRGRRGRSARDEPAEPAGRAAVARGRLDHRAHAPDAGARRPHGHRGRRARDLPAHSPSSRSAATTAAWRRRTSTSHGGS